MLFSCRKRHAIRIQFLKTIGMACSRPSTNEEIKHRVLNVYAKFVTDVEPDRLSDWLVQENVITIGEKQRIRNTNSTTTDRCRALLDHLFTIQHPGAFLIVRDALRETNHHLLEYIDNQNLGFQPQTENALHEDTMELNVQLLEKQYEDQKNVREADCLLNMEKLESKLQLYKDKVEQLEKDNYDQKRAWEAEKDRLLTMLSEHERQKKILEAENLRLLKMSKDFETKLCLEETEQLMSATIDHTAKIQELETELERRRSDVRSLEDQLQGQSDTNKELQEKNEASEIKISQLVAKMQDLEQRLYRKGNIDYAETPTRVHTIATNASKQRRVPISGMTILGSELFVSHEKESAIEVYDLETFQLGRTWLIDGVSRPMDIASSKIANCIYIIFQVKYESESRILKFDPKGGQLKKWSTGGEYGRLSTYESSVIVCLFEKQVIHEFSGDGNLIHTVRLSPADGLIHPWHAIKVTSGHFAVCHGDVNDELHRVCIINIEGTILKELRKRESKQKDGKLNVPICLAADSEWSILMADRDNHKIRLLNCFLKLQRNLINLEKGIDGHPVRIFLDETKGRLFVATNILRSSKKEWKDGRILIFNIR